MKRMRYLLTGTVQGVGFRPFVYRLATQYNLAGFVQNSPDGVIVEVEGKEERISRFISDVKENLPPLADLTSVVATETDLAGETGFKIAGSESAGRKEVLTSPDAAICSDCLAELFDPADRRYRYPFINCTNCGPRLTIIKDIPYDRANTSMACFPFCADCAAEYENPLDRRFHAEPNACPVCGPNLKILDAGGSPIRDADPLQKTVDLLAAGSVVAIKGIGGFHLAVDAMNSQAVERLKSRKFREEKPLAIMVGTMDQALEIAQADSQEQALLLASERPIVLLTKKDSPVSPAVAPGVPNMGIMLPYAPLHHLLFRTPTPAGSYLRALVMTSANQTDEPICIGNREAVTRLAGIADVFLTHNRDILVRCDDSIAMVVENRIRLLRRSRGFVPRPLQLTAALPDTLALGGQMKGTVCIIRNKEAFLSPHIGDLDTPEARNFFEESIQLMYKLAERKPALIACDLHPGYYTSQYASRLEGVRVIPVQHHHAHIVSCMAENGLSGQVIGLAMDGTGYGTDGQIWGGEFLVADASSFTRCGHLRYYRLPGGEAAIHEPWRTAVSLLHEAYGQSWPAIAEELHLLPPENKESQGPGSVAILNKMMSTGLNSPWTSSLGRLYDGFAALIGLRSRVSFEGQAAMELEAKAEMSMSEGLPFTITEKDGEFIVDFSDAVKAAVEMRRQGAAVNIMASAFQATLPRLFAAMAERIREKTELRRVVLSGGCFQNRMLLEESTRELSKEGFEVFSHSRIPTNDGCIALGQAVCAASIVKTGKG
jgi:hydrogenase maturation protein HypF